MLLWIPLTMQMSSLRRADSMQSQVQTTCYKPDNGPVKQTWHLNYILPESQQSTYSDTASTQIDIIVLQPEPCIRRKHSVLSSLHWLDSLVKSVKALMCGHEWTGSRALPRDTFIYSITFPSRKKRLTSKRVLSLHQILCFAKLTVAHRCVAYVYPISVSKSPWSSLLITSSCFSKDSKAVLSI